MRKLALIFLICFWATAAFGQGQNFPGATLPANASVVSTNSSSQGVAANTNNIHAPSYVAGGGTAQAQTATLSPAITSLVAGQTQLCWLPIAANTTSGPTLAVNGLTATAITKIPNNTALAANDLITTAPACVIYDGTQFELQNPQTSASAGAPYYFWTNGAGTDYLNFPGSGAILVTAIAITPGLSFGKLAFYVGAADASTSDYYGMAIAGPCSPGASSCSVIWRHTGVNLTSTGIVTPTALGSIPVVPSAPTSGQFYYLLTTGSASVAAYDYPAARSFAPVCANSSTTSTSGTIPSTVEIPAESWTACNYPAIGLSQ